MSKGSSLVPFALYLGIIATLAKNDPGAFFIYNLIFVMPIIFVPMGFGIYFIGHLIGISGW